MINSHFRLKLEYGIVHHKYTNQGFLGSFRFEGVGIYNQRNYSCTFTNQDDSTKTQTRDHDNKCHDQAQAAIPCHQDD